MSVAADVILTAVGIAMIVLVFDSALRTFVLPRGVTTLLTRLVFVPLRLVFNLFARESHSYERRDRVLALYGPLGLLSLVLVWITMLLIGYLFPFRAISVDT